MIRDVPAGLFEGDEGAPFIAAHFPGFEGVGPIGWIDEVAGAVAVIEDHDGEEIDFGIADLLGTGGGEFWVFRNEKGELLDPVEERLKHLETGNRGIFGEVECREGNSDGFALVELGDLFYDGQLDVCVEADLHDLLGHELLGRGGLLHGELLWGLLRDHLIRLLGELGWVLGSLIRLLILRELILGNLGWKRIIRILRGHLMLLLLRGYICFDG